MFVININITRYTRSGYQIWKHELLNPKNSKYPRSSTEPAKICKYEVTCFIHEGRRNLKRIRFLLSKIKPDHNGWKEGIHWNIERKGYLETMINFRHLREDLLKTKKMIDDFNKYRINLPRFINKINFHLANRMKEIKI